LDALVYATRGNEYALPTPRLNKAIRNTSTINARRQVWLAPRGRQAGRRWWAVMAASFFSVLMVIVD
jgi:hypothetical protein